MSRQKHGPIALLITLLGAGCHAGSLDSLTEFDDGASSTADSGATLVRVDEAPDRDTETSTGDAPESVDEELEEVDPLEPPRQQESALGESAEEPLEEVDPMGQLREQESALGSVEEPLEEVDPMGQSREQESALGSVEEPLEEVDPMGQSREQALGLAAGAEPLALGKECNATCTVVSLGTGMCPETISGFGYTTFLGGCKKACNKARDDAASKLPEGCQINNCNLTGC